MLDHVGYCVDMSSGYPNLAGPPPLLPGAHPPRARWDVALSVALLSVCVIVWVIAAGGGLMILAFTDFCPVETCHIHRASVSIAVALSVAAVFIVAGAALAIIWIIRRRLGWPFAAAALVLSVMSEVLGFAGYIAAVGY
jgi:hypothetical protein